MTNAYSLQVKGPPYVAAEGTSSLSVEHCDRLRGHSSAASRLTHQTSTTTLLPQGAVSAVAAGADARSRPWLLSSRGEGDALKRWRGREAMLLSGCGTLLCYRQRLTSGAVRSRFKALTLWLRVLGVCGVVPEQR